ncbi:MAG: GNAT family N-acetyltransferase [Anaerolineae bacterium]
MTHSLVRPMTIEDYPRVLAVWQASEGVGLSSADSRESITGYLARNPGHSFVAEVDGALVGAVLCGHDGRRGYIHHLAVHPDYRRRGIGRELTAHCLAALREAGIQKCHLFVFGENGNGRQFWQDIGWTERGELVLMSRTTATD